MSEERKGPALEKGSPEAGGQSEDEVVAAVQEGVVVNASGYKDQLRRQYSLLGLAGIALTVDNAWVALGSSISLSLCKTNKHSKRDRPVSMANIGDITQPTVDPLVLSSVLSSPFSITRSLASGLLR